MYLKPAVDALVGNADFGSRVKVYAYVDDVHIVGSVDDVLAAYTALVQHLSDIELTVNPSKCGLLYFHNDAHPLTADQLEAIHDAGLQWDASRCDAADVLGAVIGIHTAAISRRLDRKFGGAVGLFGVFFRRVRSGGLSVQAAMLLLAHSVTRLAYLQRCLPAGALEAVARGWDDQLIAAATRVLDVAESERTATVVESLQRPRSLGGFGLSSAVHVSPLAFIASVASSAALLGDHPLAANTLPPSSLLREWLDAALTSPPVTLILRHASVDLHSDASTFTGHYHAQPDSTLLQRPSG